MEARELTLNSKPSCILELETYLSKVFADFHINDERCPDILISVTEAVNNAIIHGNKSDENKVVHVDCNTEHDCLCVTVSDEGIGFDPDAVPDPTTPDHIECCGGRGVFIMSRLADQISFKDNGRKVEMYFKLA